MKVTFLQDTGPIAATGWEYYPKGAKASLTGGAELVAGGYAREGWGMPKPKQHALSFIDSVKATLKFKASDLPDPGPEPSPLPEPDPREGEPPPRLLLKVDLEDRPVKELKKMARAAGLKGYSKMRKAELVAELAED